MEQTEGFFDNIWQQRQNAPPEPAVEQCIHAQRFAAWAEEVCMQAVRSRSLITIAQTKVLLVDKLFEWRSVVSKSHRNRIGEHGHVCIWHVFAEGYRQLKLAELSLTPPMLFLPREPPPPTQITKVYKFDSFPIGEVVENINEDE